MAGERRLPGNGFWGFWTLGTGGWKEGMDENFLRLSVLVQGSVLSRTTAVPASPADGSIYVVPATSNANTHKIAVRDNGRWVYLDPKAGVRLYVQDTRTFAVFDGEKWVADEASGGGGDLSSFLDLDDVPDDYGAPGQIVVVGPSGNRLVFADAPSGGGGGGGIEEAPQDGSPYSRQDGAWVAAPSGGGGGGGGGAASKVPQARYWRLLITDAAQSDSGINLGELEFYDENGNLIPRENAPILFSSSNAAGNPPANAFDGNPTSIWQGSESTEASPSWIGLDFGVPRAVGSFVLKSAQTTARANRMPTTFRLERGDNNDTWMAGETFVVDPWGVLETRRFEGPRIDINPVEEAPSDGTSYVRKDGGWVPAPTGGGDSDEDDALPAEGFRDYRIVWTGARTNYAGLAEVAFDGETPAGGLAYASTAFSGGYGADRAFDGDGVTYWSSSINAADNAHLGYVFQLPRTVRTVALTAPNDPSYRDYAPVGFRVEGIAGEKTYVLFETDQLPRWEAGETKTFELSGVGVVYVEEAPDDGTPYVRQSRAWVPAPTGGGEPEQPALFDVWRVYFTERAGPYDYYHPSELRPKGLDGEDLVPLIVSSAASSVSGGADTPDKLYDGNIGTTWRSATGAIDVWVEFRFSEPVAVGSFGLQKQNGYNGFPTAGRVAARSGDVEYPAGSFSGLVEPASASTVVSIPVAIERQEESAGIEDAPHDGVPYSRQDGAWVPSPPGGGGTEPGVFAARHWRVVMLQSLNPNYIALVRMEFLDANGDVIPTTLAGRPIASGQRIPDQGPDKLFDTSASTGWNSNSTPVADGNTWAGFSFPAPVAVAAVRLTQGLYQSEAPTVVLVEYSDDGQTWAHASQPTPTNFTTAVNDAVATVDVEFDAPAAVFDAPLDGKSYVRKDGAWAEAGAGGGGGGIPDAPNDDVIYGRSNGEWFPLLDVDGLPVAPVGGARIRSSSVVPYTITGQYVPVRFDTVDRDTDGFTDREAPNRLTVPAGVTKVRLAMSVKAESRSGSFPANAFIFAKNGVVQNDSGLSFTEMPTGGFTNPGASMVSDVLDVTEGDYFEVNAYLHGEMSLNSDRFQTWFAIEVVERRLSSTGLNARMSDLLDADLATPADGDVAVWSETDQKWRAGKPVVAIHEAASYARPFSGAMAKLNARKALATPTLPFPWDGTDYDTDGFWSAASPGRFTVRAGVTKVRLSVGLSPDGGAWTSTTNTALEVYKNGSPFRGGAQMGWRVGFNDTGIATQTAVVPVVEGDYFEVRFNCTASGTIAWQAERCFFAIEAVEFEREIAA